MIKVYTQDGCTHCVEVKEFFKENNIEFQELDVKDDLVYLESIEAEFLPVTRFEDDTWIEGPEIEHIKRILNL